MKQNNGLKRLLMISAILLFIGGGYVSAMIFGKKVGKRSVACFD